MPRRSSAIQPPSPPWFGHKHRASIGHGNASRSLDRFPEVRAAPIPKANVLMQLQDNKSSVLITGDQRTIERDPCARPPSRWHSGRAPLLSTLFMAGIIAMARYEFSRFMHCRDGWVLDARL